MYTFLFGLSSPSRTMQTECDVCGFKVNTTTRSPAKTHDMPETTKTDVTGANIVMIISSALYC